MRVLVDTSVWSEALRRAKKTESAVVREFRGLILEHRVEIIGPGPEKESTFIFHIPEGERGLKV